MSVSPQEKEKLRKRLQKLFQSEEYLKKGPTNHASSQQYKNTTNNFNKTKTSKDNLNNSNNNKMPEQKSVKSPKLAPLQHGLANTAGKQIYGNKMRPNEKVSSKQQPPNNNTNILQKPNNMKKGIKVQMLMQTKTFGSENTIMKESSKLKSGFQQNNSGRDNYLHIREIQPNAAKGRGGLKGILKSTAISDKNQKLIKNCIEKDLQINKKKINLPDESRSSSEYDDEYDVCSEKSNENVYREYLSHSKEETSDGADNQFEIVGFEGVSFAEKDKNYSDEDDYDYSATSADDVPEDSSLSPESDNVDEFESSEYDDESDDDESDDDDSDYELPEHVPEDLIIHQGTCIKRDLKPEDNVSFDRKEKSYIVELKNQQTVKIIEQPKAYAKEELLKLKVEERPPLGLTTFQKKESIPNDDDDCPKLVPIDGKDGLKLCNPREARDEDESMEVECEDESMGEEYEDESMQETENGEEECVEENEVEDSEDEEEDMYEDDDCEEDDDDCEEDDYDEEDHQSGTKGVNYMHSFEYIPYSPIAFGNNTCTKFFNAFNSNSVIVLLKNPFYIYGTVRLTLLAGSMEVYGHTLNLNTEVEIFSPRGCSVIEISSIPTKNNISEEGLNDLLKSYAKQFGLNDLNTIVSLYDRNRDSVVLLKRNYERKKVVQQYKKFMNENVFPNIKNINADRPLYSSEYLLRCMINTSISNQKCLNLPKEWQQFSLTSKSRVMLVGGKSVGKSTLLRYLINRHLPQKVLLIDLDIGQPEVFIPQTISCTIIEQPLLGPGFLLNLQPEISFAIGQTNISLCAYKYLNAVRSLMAYCRQQEAFKNIPWIVNTMGYNKGFAMELISVLAQGQQLTDIIQLQSSREINNYESTLEAHVLSNVPHILFPEEYECVKEEIKAKQDYRLHVWQSAVEQESRYQKEWKMSAKDLRFAILLARLSQALQGHADWLTDVKPLSASLDDLKIINLMNNTPLMSEEDLAKSIEANLVYLCQYEEDSKPLKCLGIGVVRAIDFHVRHVYLIPALPYTLLKDVNCLAIGAMPLPTSLFTNQGPKVKNIAPFVYNTIAASTSKAIKQIYHRPSKFLTGKHKSLD